jgi:DNA-binding MurR/RpiR family transcriptional regulator
MIVSDLKRAYSGMHDAEKRVANFILEHPQKVTQMSMAELSSETDTSDATIMRVCRRINQSGFYQLKIALAMDSASADSATPPTEDPDAPHDVVSLVDTIAANVSQLSKEISMAQVEACVDLIAHARTVFTFGWGNTSTAADDLAHRLLCYGADTFTSTNIEYIMRRIVLANERDILIAFSRSGESVYTVECCKLARANGLKVILITGDPQSAASRLATVTLKASPVHDVANAAWGSSSHVYEFAVSDILVYFFQKKRPAYDMGLKSEAILGQFKN